MKINIGRSLLLLFISCLYGAFPGLGLAGVNVNIGVFAPPPPIVVAGPPAMAVIPGTPYVYFAPDVSVDLFFYSGNWYRTHEGHWFRARSYRGPWKYMDHHSISPVLVKLPPDYRKIPPGHQKIPYGQMKKNWRNWEKERHWDGGANGRYGHDIPYGRSTMGRKNSEHHNMGNGRRKN